MPCRGHAAAPHLRVGQDQLLARVEDGTRHIVKMAAERVHLPGLGLWQTACGHRVSLGEYVRVRMRL
jgi:hypothetical protein